MELQGTFFLILNHRYVKIVIVWRVALTVFGCYYVAHLLVNHVYALMTWVNILSVQAMDLNLLQHCLLTCQCFVVLIIICQWCCVIVQFHAKRMLWIRLTLDSSYPCWSVDEFICKLLQHLLNSDFNFWIASDFPNNVSIHSLTKIWPIIHHYSLLNLSLHKFVLRIPMCKILPNLFTDCTFISVMH